MTTRVVDHGAAALLSFLADASASPSSVDVGVIGSKAAKQKADGVTVADVATWAELGLGQPMRSWLRAYIAENEKAVRKIIQTEMIDALQGKQTKSQAVKRIGLFLVGEIQERISDGIEPANAPSTIAAKGSSTPLIDTGQLRSSITSRVNE